MKTKVSHPLDNKSTLNYFLELEESIFNQRFSVKIVQDIIGIYTVR